jgi:hypothetical protein
MAEPTCDECGADATDGASGMCYPCWKALALPSIRRTAAWNRNRYAEGDARLRRAFAAASKKMENVPGGWTPDVMETD